MQTTQPFFRSNPLPSDSQPTSASWIRWIGYGWKLRAQAARCAGVIYGIPSLTQIR